MRIFPLKYSPLELTTFFQFFEASSFCDASKKLEEGCECPLIFGSIYFLPLSDFIRTVGSHEELSQDSIGAAVLRYYCVLSVIAYQVAINERAYCHDATSFVSITDYVMLQNHWI